GSSADGGVEFKGFADPNHRIGYSAMVGNGIGQKPEDNRNKKGYLAFPIKLTSWRFEPYVDYENVANSQDKATYKMFVGYEARLWAAGVEAVDRVNHRATLPNQEPRGVSVWARGGPNTTWGGFARIDFWQPDHRSQNRVDSQLYIAGLDFQPYKDIH